MNDVFSYDAETGSLVWKDRPREHFKTLRGFRIFHKRFAGKPAGSPHTSNNSQATYLICWVNGKAIKAHRLIWELMTGQKPDGLIDHIDGNGLNNKWDNLRIVSPSESAKNKPRQSNNTSGVVGVRFRPKTGKWHSRIQDNGRERLLTYTDDFFEAVCARKSAELRLGYHSNHGRV